jgi:hypothetical protein
VAKLILGRGLGTELQRRGIARHTQWGAYGVVVSPMLLFASGPDQATEPSLPYNFGRFPP